VALSYTVVAKEDAFVVLDPWDLSLIFISSVAVVIIVERTFQGNHVESWWLKGKYGYVRA
jgi:hypothetical protein